VQSKKIVILGTGGTIAGAASSALDSRDYIAAQRGVGDLVAGLPPPAGYELLSEQVAQVDSKNMDVAVWQDLLIACRRWLARDDVQGLVITHGTDTLEETAYLLQAVLAPTKPVVLTCAMLPATALGADGPRNLLDAMVVAAYPGACGTVVTCAGKIHGAQDVQKLHSWQLDAYSSGDAGVLGRINQAGIVMYRDWPRGTALSEAVFDWLVKAASWPRVEIVLSHAGAGAAMVDALVSHALGRQLGAEPLRGLVAATTGGGTLHHQLAQALERAQACGIRVIRASRCALGGIPGRPDDVFAGAGSLSPVKARLQLLLELAADSQASC